MSLLDHEIPAVQAEINYLDPGSRINRRFVAPGAEVNTGRFVAHRVTIRDARPTQGRFTLASNGFALAEHYSAVRDFFDRDAVDAIYPGEAAGLIRRLTGATLVVPLGWMVRTSGDLSKFARAAAGYTHQGGVQPPASDVHVDMMPERAEAMAEALYAKTRPDGPGFKRFIASSLWRCFSAPPQDWPLALCDGRSVTAAEGVPNTMFIVDALPDEATMRGAMPDEHDKPAAAVFRHSPNHRWWYFSDMRPSEVLLFKFHDSDRTGAWRTPHTAFRHPDWATANVRSSIELRSVAFFE
jgi:hypothetical protein